MVIETESEYNDVLAEIIMLFDAMPDTPDGDRLQVLVDAAFEYAAVASAKNTN